MIEIKKSTTADTRTCDVSTVDKAQLLASSIQHIGDVGKGLAFLASRLTEAASIHDYDKLTEIDWFLADFKTSFKEHTWWDHHRRIHRHHLNERDGELDGVPEDVNLIDVLEYITDCVMAAMGRTGKISYPITIDSNVLQRAFENTIELLKSQVVVNDE